MKGGYQILDLKGVDLSELNGTTKVIELTKEEVKGLESGKPILLNNVVYKGSDFGSLYATNTKENGFLDIVVESSDVSVIVQLAYSLEDKKIELSYEYHLSEYALPDLPETTANKTYVLKLVNGSLTWVEETE